MPLIKLLVLVPFSPVSSPKSPHFITLADGSKIVAKGIGHAAPTSMPLKSVLFIPRCPISLISLAQLTRSLNCSVTFNVDSFVIQECGTSRMIGTRHESHGLYYLQSAPSRICVAIAVSLNRLHQ